MNLNAEQRMFLENKIKALEKSKFRSGFCLKEKDFKYIEKIGLVKVEEHAYQFIRERLAVEKPANDGKQTPMRGHPVFVAQHATATCCRGCLNKWHHIEKNKELSEKEIRFIVALIMYWIKKEVSGVI